MLCHGFRVVLFIYFVCVCVWFDLCWCSLYSYYVLEWFWLFLFCQSHLSCSCFQLLTHLHSISNQYTCLYSSFFDYSACLCVPVYSVLSCHPTLGSCLQQSCFHASPVLFEWIWVHPKPATILDLKLFSKAVILFVVPFTSFFTLKALGTSATISQH